jgi:hypothetical protein
MQMIDFAASLTFKALLLSPFFASFALRSLFCCALAPYRMELVELDTRFIREQYVSHVLLSPRESSALNERKRKMPAGAKGGFKRELQKR